MILKILSNVILKTHDMNITDCIIKGKRAKAYCNINVELNQIIIVFEFQISE